MVINKEGAHNVGNDYSRYVATIFFSYCSGISVFSFNLVYYLYILMVIIIIYFICSNQSGMYQVKYMNVYIEHLIEKLLKLWNEITMYDVSRPIQQRKDMMPQG